MADKRMFSKSIVLSDAFLDMPMSARCLYFTLSMLADDDGFVNSPKSIMRQCGASEDDLKVLFSKCFLIPFESGIVVIKHWRINNYLRCDRYKETNYTEEKAQLVIEQNGAYTMVDRVGQVSSNLVWQQYQNNGLEPVQAEVGNLKVEPPKKVPLIEREPKNDLERVEKAYLLNYKTLYESGVVRMPQPVINWTACRKLTNDCITKYGIDNVVNAVTKSINSEFCVRKGYSLTTILSNGVLSELLNGYAVKQDVQKVVKQNQKEKVKEMLKTHPIVCKYCNGKLEDISGVGTLYFCKSCRCSWGLKNGQWTEDG